MLGLSERSIEALTFVLVGVFLAGVVLAIAAGTGIIKIPTFNLFDVINVFFDQLERQLGIAGMQARDFFCAQSLKDAEALCQITDQQLEAECERTPVDREAACQAPERPASMDGWCSRPAKDKEEICTNPKQFLAGCENLATFKRYELLGKLTNPLLAVKDLPFCDGKATVREEAAT